MGTGRIPDKFDKKKTIFPFRPQCGTGIIDHSCRTVMIVSDRGNKICGLPVPSGAIHILVHPNVITIVLGICIFSVLPIGPPTGIRTIHNIDQSLAFPGMVAIVVRTYYIAIFIKNKFMGVPKSVGKYLKVAAIGIGPNDYPFVGIFISTS